jgi:uncharacterized protein
MIELDSTPHLSPLSQSITRDGKTVQIDIYENGEGGWILEVVDAYGNSTVWDDSFASDRQALDEALIAIDEDGMDSLIGPSTERRGMSELDQSLSEDELNELDDFLADESIEETSMDVSTLEGFLTAIAIGPRAVMPSEWLPWVWDRENGETQAKFESAEQANRIMSLVMRHYNAVVHTFMGDPASFEPVFSLGEQWGAAKWCEGFLLGFQFNEEAWSLLAVGQPTWFTPFLRLGTDDGIDITKRSGDAEKWMNEVEQSLVKMHAFWKDRRANQQGGLLGDDFHLGGHKEVAQVVRGGPKIGRNDPCPCGSGKKFKKCCGANDTPATLH